MKLDLFEHIRICIDWLITLVKMEFKEHFLRSVIITYSLVVVIAAGINWLVFLHNSTSYLISDQLNKHVERYEFLSPEIDLATYHENAKDKMPVTISEFGVMVKSDLDKLQATNDSLSIKNQVLNDCKVLWDSLSNVASGLREDSIKQVRERHLAGYQERIDSLRQYLAGEDSTEMIIKGKYVELANLEYQFAKRNEEVQSMISQYMGNFIPDSLSHNIRRCNENYIWLTMEIQELESVRRKTSSNIRYLVTEFHKNRLESVGWMDFLYYSICVSTTVSFGDIAPNNGVTRFLAIFELLICLVLVGAIVDRIIKKE